MPIRVFIYKSDQVWGPFTIPEIEGMLSEERILLSDLATLEDSEDWKPLSDLVEVRHTGPQNLLPAVDEIEMHLEELEAALEQEFGASDLHGMRRLPGHTLMERVEALKPGDFIKSDSRRAHFRDVVSAFEAVGATRRGSREIMSPEGDPYIVDVYILRDGREVLAGYMDPEKKATRDGLAIGKPGETTETAVRRLIAMTLEVEGGIASVEMTDELGSSKLRMNLLTQIDLTMACEREFGVKLGAEAERELANPHCTVADLVRMIEEARR